MARIVIPRSIVIIGTMGTRTITVMNRAAFGEGLFKLLNMIAQW